MLDGRPPGGQRERVGLPELVERMTRDADPAVVARARVAFEAATGPFVAGETWYEERIAAFFDYALVAFDGGALAARFAARGDVDPEERALALAMRRGERSVFRVERIGADRVLEGLFGARYRVAPVGVGGRLLGGEWVDGRLVSASGSLELMPGAIFHPSEAHEAIDAIVRSLREPGATERARSQEDLADALLRMRMRFDRFTSMHARHVYRYDAIGRTEILAASWARPDRH